MNKTPIQWTWDVDEAGNLIPMSGSTWNPLLGCREVSAGCRNCYAARLIGTRFSKNPKLPMYHDIATTAANGHPHFTGNRRMVPDRLDEPLRARKGRKVFVCDMGDLFFEGHPFESIAAVFGVIAAAPQHTFQVLTKRPERAAEFFAWVGSYLSTPGAGVGATVHPFAVCTRAAQEYMPGRRELSAEANYARRPVGGSLPWPLPNVWIGTSVEDQASADKRIPHLLRVPAVVRFLSMEPLLGPVDLDEWICPTALGRGMAHRETREARGEPGHEAAYRVGGDIKEAWACETCDVRDTGGKGLHWVIVGGESGPKARPFDLAWARAIMKQADDAGCAVFLKQLGAHPFVEVHGVHAERIRPPRVRDSHGGDPAEWPADLRVRRFPSPTRSGGSP